MLWWFTGTIFKSFFTTVVLQRHNLSSVSKNIKLTNTTPRRHRINPLFYIRETNNHQPSGNTWMSHHVVPKISFSHFGENRTSHFPTCKHPSKDVMNESLSLTVFITRSRMCVCRYEYFIHPIVGTFQYYSSTVETENQESLDPKQCFKKCTKRKQILLCRQWHCLGGIAQWLASVW